MTVSRFPGPVSARAVHARNSLTCDTNRVGNSYSRQGSDQGPTPRPVRPVAVLLPVLMLLLMAGSLLAADDGRDKPISKLADLNGRRIGVLVGTMMDIAAENGLDYTQLYYYEDLPSMIEALINHEVDAVIDDEPVTRMVAAVNPGLRVLEEQLEAGEIGFAVKPDRPRLLGILNQSLAAFKEDGTLDYLMEKWLEGPRDKKIMPKPPESGSSDRIFIMGTSSVSEPFSYPGPDGAAIGLDLEMAMIIAERQGFRLDIVDMSFGELFPSLISGKVDFIGGCLTITDEREKVVDFTEGYYLGGVAALVRDE